MKEQYIIRLERKEEQREVENLVRESFWNVYRPGCLEHYVLHQLRQDKDFIPELDFVMDMERSCWIIRWRKQPRWVPGRYALKEILISMERVVSWRQVQKESGIMECRKGKMRLSSYVKN